MSDLLTDTASWSLLLGAVMPWLVAVVNQPQWTPRTKKIVAVGASVLGGILVCLSTGALFEGPLTVVGAVVTVLVASQAVYRGIARKTARKLEEATSPGGRHRAPEVVEGEVDGEPHDEPVEGEREPGSDR